MSTTTSRSPDACDLETVIATSTMMARPARHIDSTFETATLIKLSNELAESPENFFQKLTDAALELSSAHSTGISLLNSEAKAFVWPAVSGPFKAYLGEGTPSDFGPCGTVLDRNQSLLMQHPERHFTYLQPIQPALEEVLLVPFYLDGKAVGTIWAVHHGSATLFDSEDKRVLEGLSAFAASAYHTLSKVGSLKRLLQTKR